MSTATLIGPATSEDMKAADESIVGQVYFLNPPFRDRIDTVLVIAHPNLGVAMFPSDKTGTVDQEDPVWGEMRFPSTSQHLGHDGLLKLLGYEVVGE